MMLGTTKRKCKAMEGGHLTPIYGIENISEDCQMNPWCNSTKISEITLMRLAHKQLLLAWTVDPTVRLNKVP